MWNSPAPDRTQNYQLGSLAESGTDEISGALLGSLSMPIWAAHSEQILSMVKSHIPKGIKEHNTLP